MRRFLLILTTVLFCGVIAVAFGGFFYARNINSYNAEIRPIRLDSTLGENCAERRTTDDFIAFWEKFQNALRSENKDELFSLIHVCGFVWDEYPTLPLKPSDCVPGIIGCRYAYASGEELVFENRGDFERTYPRIFSKTNKEKTLTGLPWQTESGYKVSWEAAPYETLSLRFERVKDYGYKFVGLEFDPESLELVRTREAKRQMMTPDAYTAPPPNSNP